jgi:hypothetical protein
LEHRLIDFDGQFQKHLSTWMQECRGQYETIEDMEKDMPSVYGKWMLQPAGWLEGATPAEFFYRYDDPVLLVGWMIAYMASSTGLPDPLFDRISSLGLKAEAPLLSVLRDEIPLPDSCDRRGVKSVVINLLNEIQSTAPLHDYIELIVSGEDSELAEVACDALSVIGRCIVEPILAALDRPMNQEALESLVDVLSNHPGDARILGWLICLFETSPRKALFASDLGKYGDEAALPALMRAQSDPGISYLDYIEIRNAIEQLGGEPEPERDFSGDPYYESLKGV